MKIDFNKFDVDKCSDVSILKKYCHYFDFAYGSAINDVLLANNVFSDDIEYNDEFDKKFNFYLNRAKEYFENDNKE